MNRTYHWDIYLDDPDIVEVIVLPDQRPTIRPPSQERELQAVCLDSNALFGLFIVLAIWSVFDVAHKVCLLISRVFRRRKRMNKYVVPRTTCNSPASGDDVTDTGSRKGKLSTLRETVAKTLAVVKPRAEIDLGQGIFKIIRLSRTFINPFDHSS